MKTKICTSLFLFFDFFLLYSQGPLGFNYQAIARDASGNPVTNLSLPVRITIQSDSTGGNTFWIEEHTAVTTNNFGLFTLVIGKGVRKSGSTAATFSNIDWTISPKFIRTEINYSGWKDMGSSRLWSVPYSMVSGELAGPVKKLAVSGETSIMDEALFEVKNKNGQTVFAVYNEGVRVYVDDGLAKGATKGGFAIGGFGTVKTPSQEYFRVTRDSTRVYLNDSGVKTTKGGFAIGGFDQVKGGMQDFLTVSNDSVRIYINNNPVKGVTKGGFAIGGFDQVKAPKEEYLRVTRDSTRINMKDATKGSKGGFAIGGFGTVKGSITPFTSLTPDNYFIGHEAGMSNTTGLFNSFFGFKAGRANTSGEFNIFIGDHSGYSNKSGSYNLFIGDSSGYKNSTGYSNVFLGPWAGMNNTVGINNVAVGYAAGAYIETGNNNVNIGGGAGMENYSGNQNINIGGSAGRYNSTGGRNISIGTSAGISNKTGSLNVIIGNLAGTNDTIGTNNVYLGAYSGRYNQAGNYNVFIGNSAGRDAYCSNKLMIANSETQSPLIYGEFDNGRVVIKGNSADNLLYRTFFVNGAAGGKYAWYNDSDQKLKHNITPIPEALQKILKLRGVNFLWNEPSEGMEGLQMGFIGQEVVGIVPEIVSVKNDHYSMQYAPVTALLVEAMKEQQKQIESFSKENQKLKSELDELKTQFNNFITNQRGQSNK